MLGNGTWTLRYIYCIWRGNVQTCVVSVSSALVLLAYCTITLLQFWTLTCCCFRNQRSSAHVLSWYWSYYLDYTGWIKRWRTYTFIFRWMKLYFLVRLIQRSVSFSSLLPPVMLRLRYRILLKLSFLCHFLLLLLGSFTIESSIFMENHHIICWIPVIYPSWSVNLYFSFLYVSLTYFIRSSYSSLIHLRFLRIWSRLKLLVILSSRPLMLRRKSRWIVLRIIHRS